MTRRGSIEAFNREPFSPPRYITRSVSRSCANQPPLATLSGEHGPLVEEVPGAQVPTPESEVQDPILSVHEDNGQLVSRLFDSITQFWSLIIQDEALPLSQAQADERQDRPLSPPTTIANDIVSREDCYDSPEATLGCDGVNEPLSDAAMSDAEELEAGDRTPGPDDHTHQTKFNLENLLLGEELKRLRVWKATFSNEELNRFPFIQHEVAQGVLKCLTGVANTLIKGYGGRQPSTEPGGLAPIEESLRHLIKQVEARILVTSVEDDAMTNCAVYSENLGRTMTTENETPLKALRFDLDRLQMLSWSLRLALDNGIISTTNG